MTTQEDPLVSPSLPLMFSPTKGQVLPLSPWASSFVTLGGFAAMQPSAHPMTLALSLPTRTFAAVLVALGAVLARRKLTVSPINDFEEVWKMSEHVDVRYRRHSQPKPGHGTVVARVERDGRRYLVIEDRKNGNTQLPHQLFEELVIQQNGRQRPAKALTFGDPWLERMLEGCEVAPYLFHDRYDCLIVGQDSLLRHEAALELSLPGSAPGAPRLSGTVDSVLRVHRWQGGGKVFSSDVVPTSCEIEDVNLTHLQAFPAVIFDGAGAFLRWHYQLRGQHHVVLLSKTDRKLEETLSVLDKAFMYRTVQEWPLPPLPVGIEALVFGRGQ